jgi:hypothetical protein
MMPYDCPLHIPWLLQAARPPSSTSSAATASQEAKMREGSASLSGRRRQYLSIQQYPAYCFVMLPKSCSLQRRAQAAAGSAGVEGQKDEDLDLITHFGSL